MKKGAQYTSYTLIDHAAWAVEDDFIYLLNKLSGEAIEIAYPDAVFFDLISRDYEFDKTVNLVGHIASIPFSEAHDLCMGLLEKWTELGFFEKIEGAHD